MKIWVLGITVSVTASAALGVTLDDLNIARDPENVDDAVFVETPFDLELRSGPGNEFSVICKITKGSRLPIIAWFAARYKKGFWVRTWYGEKKGWLYCTREVRRYVESDPKISGLNLESGFDKLGYRPIGRSDDPKVYAGPGFEYEEIGFAPFGGPIYFIEGSWVLTATFHDYGWLYVGADDEPAVNIYEYVVKPFERQCPLPSDLDSDTIDVGLYMAVKLDCWPTRRNVYLELHSPLGCVFFKRAKLDGVKIYQPSQAIRFIYRGSPTHPVAWSTHEVPRLTYAIGLPTGFEWDEPFRVVTYMHYEGAQEFEMEFLCNADE